MSDVFISYKRDEREDARRVADALLAQGYTVWWDAELLPGEQYRTVTLQILESCRAAIVIWSPRSIASDWVLDEAQRAHERGVLVPVAFEPLTRYPLGLGQVHAHDLAGWDGDPAGAAFQPVIAAVRRLAGAPTAAVAAPSAAEAEAEIAFWRGIHDSRKADDFEAYLTRYPKGLFADLARARLEALPARRARAPRKRIEALADLPADDDAKDKSEPAPAPSSSRPRFARDELIFVAIVAVLAPFFLWPLTNMVLGFDEIFYGQDMSGLLKLDRAHNVFFLAPLLTGLVWGYDRAAAHWAALPRATPERLPFLLTLGVLVLLLLVSLGIRDHNGRETHLTLWALATWTAALFARTATPWLRQRAPFLKRAKHP